MKTNGIIVYEGPSQIDGKPIVAIATGFSRKSNNPKTGDMIQTFILRAGISAHEAHSCGADFSVCGDCKHRKWGTCYVNVYQSPNNVSKAYMDGSYEKFGPNNAHLFVGRKLRIGSYGDPAAVPFGVWNGLVEMSSGHDGYSHQWKNCDPRFKKIVMASVDNIKEMKQAHAMGWRTFRVVLPEDKPTQAEFVCPASDEGGKKIQCDKCLCCSGLASKAKSVTIVAHGGGIGNFKAARFIAIMRKIRQKKKYTHLIPV